MTNTNVRNRTGAVSKGAEHSKALGAATLTVGLGAGAIVGLWSVACFVGGVIASGGPVSFVAAWFKAVFGL
jgi:hypothetical protein